MPSQSLSARLVHVSEGLVRRRELGPVVGLVAIVVVFSSLSGRLFETQQIAAVTSLASAIGIVALGVTFLMISGEFDLSVGAMYGLAAVVFGKLVGEQHVEPLLALVIVLGIAACVGAVNGLVTTWFGIPSFIATLAALLIIQGVNIVISGGDTVLFFGESAVVGVLGGQVAGAAIAAPMVWFAALTAVLWFVLEWTVYGNWASAAGGRAGVARAMGVPARRVKVLNFVISASFAAFAGIVHFASYGSASATDGQQYELYAIVAAVIGGTALFGVTGTMVGTFIGALILGLLQSGLVLVGVSGSWYTPLIGVILVVAVIVNVRLAKLNVGALLGRMSIDPVKEVSHGE
jgi:simple sugar transport system permease protein